MARAMLERVTASLIRHRRSYSLAAASVALVVVLIVAPRMEGPRYLFGVRLTTKTGTPGLTDLGLVLLVVVPLVTYVAMSGLLAWLEDRSSNER